MSTALNRTLGSARLALEHAPFTISSARCFGTQPPRPPLPSRQSVIETFSETSRPRPYYANNPNIRELPRTKVYYFIHFIEHGLLFLIFFYTFDFCFRYSLGGHSLSEL